MVTAIDRGANLNEYAAQTAAPNGDCEILSNLYPSPSVCKAVEGRREITSRDFEELSDVSSVSECKIIQNDGIDKYALVVTKEATSGCNYCEIVDIDKNSVYANMTKYQQNYQNYVAVNEHVYTTGSHNGGNSFAYYDTKEENAKARSTIKTTEKNKEIPLAPKVSVSGVIPSFSYYPLIFKDGDSNFCKDIYKQSSSGGGYVIVEEEYPTGFDADMLKLADANFNLFKKTTKTKKIMKTESVSNTDGTTTQREREVEESDGYCFTPRDAYKVNYIFTYVRHVDESNDDLFSQNNTPRVCFVFNVPESHGLIKDSVVTTHTLIRDNVNYPVNPQKNITTGIVSVEFTCPKKRIAGVSDEKYTRFYAFSIPKFTFTGVSINKDNVTHIRVYRTAEIEGGDTFDKAGAQAGMAYRFLCDIEIKGRTDIEWQDGDSDLSVAQEERTFVCNDVHVASSDNLYTFFGCFNMPITPLLTFCFNRFFCLDKTKNILLMSMFPGQGGFQGGAQYPYMYRTLFAANNYIKIPENITAVYPFGKRLIIFTQNKIYSVENANNYKSDGTLVDAPIEISASAGTIFPKAIAEFDNKIYFVDSDGDISQIYGTEVKKTGIKIKAFKERALQKRDGNTTDTSVTAIAWRDMLIFNCNEGQDYFNFRLYCKINRPSENISGAFTYDRYETGAVGGKVLKYGELDYGEGNYGYWEKLIEGRQVAFAAGNYLYAFGKHDKYRQSSQRRICRLFVDELFEDEFIGEDSI